MGGSVLLCLTHCRGSMSLRSQISKEALILGKHFGYL